MTFFTRPSTATDTRRLHSQQPRSKADVTLPTSWLLQLRASDDREREWIFTLPFLPISIPKSTSYSHSRPIPKLTHSKALQCKCKQSTVERQKTVPHNTGHQSLKNNNSKNTIHNIWKRDKHICSHPSKYYTQLRRNRATVHEIRRIFPHGNRGHSISIYVHSHSFPFPFPTWNLILIPINSHGISVPTGNPSPMVTCTASSSNVMAHP